MFKKILYISMQLGLLLSCVKTDRLEMSENIVTFSCVQGRATQSAWEEGDKVGVFMVRESAPGVWETIVDDAFNKCYTTNGDGVFIPATGNDAIKVPKDGKKVNFVAYYPYDDALPRATPCLYGLDMTVQGDWARTDFLVSRNLEEVTVDETVLTLDFKKPLSKVVINIRTQIDLALLEGMTVAIHGVKQDKAAYALLNTNDPLINVLDSETPTMAQVSMRGSLAEATLLCAPNVLTADSRFVFTLKDGRTMTYRLPKEVHLQSGVRYIYDIILKDANTPDYIDIAPKQVLDFKIEGGKQTLSVLSEAPWSIKTAPEWVECSPRGGEGALQAVPVTLTFGVNHQGLKREGEIVFEQKDGTRTRVAVSQKGFTASNPTANFLIASLSQSVPDVMTYPSRDIDSGWLSWSYYSESFLPTYVRMEPTDWIRFSYPSPSRQYLRSGEDLRFSIDNNNSSQPREMVVRLENPIMESLDVDTIRYYKIVQQGATDYLEVSQAQFNSRGKGDHFDFVVRSRYDHWTMENVPSWVSVTRGRPSANNTPVNIVCSANTGVARSAKITIRSGELTQIIDVTQNVKKVQTYPFTLSYSAIVHAFAGAGFEFVGASQGQDNYANTVFITVRPGDGTSYEEAKSYKPYGFVVDPPYAREFKSTEIAGRTMALSYQGTPTTIAHIDVTITYNGWTYIRRSNIYNVPVPASLTDEDKLVYTLKMTDITNSDSFKCEITYEIK